MPHTVATIARLTGLEATGDLSVEIDRCAEPGEAGASDLALAMDPKYAADVAASIARAAVLWPGADWQGLGLEAALFAPRARVALADMGDVFADPPAIAPGIHPMTDIDPSASIGAEAAIGPFVSIGPGAVIGPRARIASHASVGAGARIGDEALLHSGVRLAAGVKIGDRFIAQPNAVVGGDGFSFVTPERGSVESAKATGAVADDARNRGLRRIASLGAVTIGDDVEVGASACVDRGTVSDTRIGSGTKIDNLVQIGHNCRIGELCLICGEVGLAGSVHVGDRVVLGGKCGVADQVRIGDDSVLGAGSMVGSNVPARSVLLGAPAVPREVAHRQFMAMRRLPRMIEQVREIRARLGM
ncbi:MAG: UDP-3-O-(3-hydroxymyristoyl)glucosamine N-acyltransferase [Pseudomonadota bacterium]